MRSSTIALVVGLLAAPLALLTSPDHAVVPSVFPQLLADNDVPNTADAPLPNVEPAGVATADRVDGAGERTVQAGPVNSTTLSGSLPGVDQTVNADRVVTPSTDAVVTPDFSK